MGQSGFIESASFRRLFGCLTRIHIYVRMLTRQTSPFLCPFLSTPY
jgi:hypothetical protein